MPGDQVKGKDSAIFFSSSSVAQRPQTQAKRRNPFEHAQQIAAHQSPRTTTLYDRTKDEISLDESRANHIK